MRTVARTRNVGALAWALGIMALLCAMAVTRHHLQMVEHYPTGHEYLTWGHAIFQEAPHYVFWGLAIPFIYLFVDRVARLRWRLPKTLLAHGRSRSAWCCSASSCAASGTA